MDDRRKTLYLVRHGRTALNAEGRLRGLADPPLDAIGHTEARAVAEALASRGLVAVRCSPLNRAATTARIIAERSGCEWESDPAFNDRDYGPWTGHLMAEVVAEFGSVDAAPGVEPSSRVLERAFPALDLLVTAADGPVCVVTHDAVIRPILRAVDPDRTDLRVPTGSWNELVRDHDRWRIAQSDRKP
ncbi:histidine phosphatase family protein [Leifsonia aquatica]|uniref:histidine phosphatase family protein n=1 Tax=Leifsonia aquatica TaxID=144185 RepID=UPI00046A910E|nr:histidine phosphatase family protein [Leifsonia aquatica]